MSEVGELDFPDAPPAFRLRPYQIEADERVEAGWSSVSRQLVIHATGTGKGSLCAHWAKKTAERGRRMLFLAHRESLVRQTAERIAEQAGVDVEIEMAGEHASLSAPVVCASVQSLSTTNRLLGFPADHFSLITADEAHHNLSNTHQRTLNYFHFGESSLAEDWKMPVPGTLYDSHARVIGLTATPDIGGKKELGIWYDKIAHEFNLLDAVREGWLVRPILKAVPLEIDLRGLTAKRTSHGSDISDSELSERLYPVIDALAKHTADMVPDKKTVAFLPSIRCADLFAQAVTKYGLRGILISSKSEDSQAVLDEFRKAGPGTVLVNCALVTEGVDIPDVSCVAMYRATKSRAFYCQCVGRASRPEKGLVDRFETAPERLAAIAASSKSEFWILDPTWRHETLQLVQAYDLVASRPEVAKILADKGVTDLVAEEAQAERDYVALLEKEMKKHANKKARVIDPLFFAVALSDASFANYLPETAWESLPPIKDQLKFISEQGIDSSKVSSRGLANKIIGKIVDRVKMNLCSPKQLTFLIQLGIPEEKAALFTKGQAGAIINSRTKK